MKSLAVVNFSSEPHSVEVREVERPTPGPEDVILKVEAASVCGSDLHQWEGTNSWPVNYPVVLGHEFAGVVDEVGERVVGWKVGDRVVSETAAEVNMHGAMSRQGLYNLDPSRKGFGYGVNGAMTRYNYCTRTCSSGRSHPCIRTWTNWNSLCSNGTYGWRASCNRWP